MKEHIEEKSQEFKNIIKNFEKELKELQELKKLKRDGARTDKKLSNDEKKNLKFGGVYLFCEKGKPLYVGRTRNIGKRYEEHCFGNEKKANFAYQLTQEKIAKATGKDGYLIRGYYPRGKTRKEIEGYHKFEEFFKEVRERISKMDFHYVKEECPLKQTLLEIYCMYVFNTAHPEKTDVPTSEKPDADIEKVEIGGEAIFRFKKYNSFGTY